MLTNWQGVYPLDVIIKLASRNVHYLVIIFLAMDIPKAFSIRQTATGTMRLFQALFGQQFSIRCIAVRFETVAKPTFSAEQIIISLWNQSNVAKAFDESGVQLNAPMILSQIVLVTFVIYHNANIHQSELTTVEN